MKKKVFEHTERTKGYIMAYLLSVPTETQRSTHEVTVAVDDAMYRDGYKPARSIGYLLKQLVIEEKAIRYGERNWGATRYPAVRIFAAEKTTEETIQALEEMTQTIDQQIQTIIDHCNMLTNVADELFKLRGKIKPNNGARQKELISDRVLIDCQEEGK